MGRIAICSSVNTDYFRFLKRCLEAQGLTLRAIYAMEEMEYRAASKTQGWSRLKLRWRMYVVYPCKLCRHALGSTQTAVFVVTSNTFFAPFLIALIGRVRRFRTIHLLYDLFPDALEVSGALSLNGFAARFIGSIIRWTQRNCSGAVYLGKLLANHAGRRWGEGKCNRSIDIGADDTLFAAHEPGDANGQVTCHYGGQLGQMHDAAALIASIQSVLHAKAGPTPCRFHFNVTGAQASRVQEVLSDSRVTIEGAIPGDAWRKAIRQYQIGLVTLSPGGASVCLPSKTYSMMAGGLAILAICPAWSDLALLILENQAGWVINNSPYSNREELDGPDYLLRIREHRPMDVVAREFTETLDRVLANRRELGEKRHNAWRSVRDRYGLQVTGANWKEYLDTHGVKPDLIPPKALSAQMQ